MAASSGAGGSQTRWAKNLRRDPRVAVAIERGGLAIMIKGEVLGAGLMRRSAP